MKGVDKMMKFTNRLYAGDADHQAILALIKSRPAQRILDYPGIADMEELLARPEIQAATRIWETDAGQFAGYALINYSQTYADLAFEYLEGFAARQVATHVATHVEDEMIAWGEQAYLDRFHGQTSELTSSARDAQPERAALLQKHGFECEAESVLYLE